MHSGVCAASRWIFRIWARDIPSRVPWLQCWIGEARSRHLEVLARRLPADSAGMGMGGKQPLGIALLRRNCGGNSQLQNLCHTRLDAAETAATAFGDFRPHRSGVTCVGRFSVSNRVDPAVRRELFGDWL